MFYDRLDAGNQLAKELEKYQGNKNALILAVPRGGVITAKIVADRLKLPLDIIISRKITAPNNPEYAIGAVAEQGEPILNEEVIGTMGITPDYLDREITNQRMEIERRLKLYRGTKSLPKLNNKIIILIDDGIATGYSVLACLEYLHSQKPKKIILAVPVTPADNLKKLKQKTDQLVCLETPKFFSAVGQFYEHFEQITDEEVIKALKTGV